MLRRHDFRQWWCRLALRALAASFAIVGATFLLTPDTTVRAMNAVGAWLGGFPPVPPSALRFWLSLATGYMVLVTALAYVAQRDLERHRDLVALLALGKATTSLVSLGFYTFSLPAFVYLVNFLVDGSITLVVLAIWLVIPSPGSAAGGAHTDPSTPDEPPARTPIDAVLEAMIPSGGPFAEGAMQVPLARDIDAFVAGVAPGAPRALRLLLSLLEYSPFFLPPLRLRRFSRLDLKDRVRLLETWERSRLMPRRQAIHMLKLLAMVHFYSRPEVEARLGYPHPLDRVPRSGEAA